MAAPTPSPLRVLLADDHRLVRAGIRSLLEEIEGVEVVAEAGDGRETLDLIRDTNPNIAMIDVAMKGLNGLDVAARITRDHPQVKVIILSMHTNEEYVLQALKNGAAGYLIKDSATEELRLALNAVRKGETYLSPVVSKGVVDNLIALSAGGENAEAAGLLTPRQREILQLIAEGKSTKEIAALLGVSVKTVETHRTQLMARLDIHEIAGLVRYAIRIGLVSAD
ncbi:MAG: response regulator transcription factor [Verrucomicrobiae bacterium]|jgi:DNA-binding NarL/FixJ family response regulator|nr:response regulator transcription factor [Verrucomicrobiae bacterium]